jgi:hypothetical protein
MNTLYTSGNAHETIMANKHKLWAKHGTKGEYESAKYIGTRKKTSWVNGKAGEFRCNKVDLLDFQSHAELGSATGQGISSWGWVENGREFAIREATIYLRLECLLTFYIIKLRKPVVQYSPRSPRRAIFLISVVCPTPQAAKPKSGANSVY